MSKIYVLVFTILAIYLLSLPKKNSPVPKPVSALVEIKKERGSFQLLRNGEPYFIKGAGAYTYYERLKQCGGNSVRLWSTHDAKQYMDKAYELGLTVTLGLDMKLERHGFNYDDKKAVKAQFEKLKEDILEFKDHPALLMWGVGNEVDQFALNYKAWNAVNDVAKFIHEVDPNHPTTTMLAGVPHHHVKEIVKRCPELDVLSINSFMDLPNIKDKITNAGWTGPYLIGEWGASGYWETPTTPWGAFIEETSTEKARVCQDRYNKAIVKNPDRCLGSYVFYWGYKQARTHTLLSLFLESGEEIGVLDVLQNEWRGKGTMNKAPLIAPIGIDDKTIQSGVYLTPGSNHLAFTDAKDPDHDSLIYKWEIYYESTEKKEGGDKEDKPEALSGLILNGEGRQLSFNAPEKEGPYRLFVYVFDNNNNVATANAPFYVK